MAVNAIFGPPIGSIDESDQDEYQLFGEDYDPRDDTYFDRDGNEYSPRDRDDVLHAEVMAQYIEDGIDEDSAREAADLICEPHRSVA